MNWAWPVLFEGLQVLGRAIALVIGKPILRVSIMVLHHQPVSKHLHVPVLSAQLQQSRPGDSFLAAQKLQHVPVGTAVPDAGGVSDSAASCTATRQKSRCHVTRAKQQCSLCHADGERACCITFARMEAAAMATHLLSPPVMA